MVEMSERSVVAERCWRGREVVKVRRDRMMGVVKCILA